VVCLLAIGAAAEESDVSERVQRLEEQNREILDRLRESEARNRKLDEELERTRRGGEDLLRQEVDAYLERSAAGADSWTESNKGARWRLYGFLRFDTYFNSARANSIITPTTVRPEDGAAVDGNNEHFAFDTRLTRVGFLFRFGEVGASTVTGKLETDFANFPSGVPESRPTPRIRVAYLQIENDSWRIRLGQDWDQISPLYPSANHETLMWNAGNLGDRRPQASILFKGSGAFSFIVALGLTGAIDNLDLDAAAPPFTSTERDGFDSGHPHVQVRGIITLGEDRSTIIGIWGMVARLETDSTFNGEDSFTPWVVGIDFTVPAGALLVKGEAWFGQALSDFRGNIGQNINTATGDEIQGVGGWAEVQYKHNDDWTFYVGGTIDSPDDADLAAGAPELNFTVFIGARRQWSARLKSALDVIFWETQYNQAAVGNMVRINFWTAVDF
jgi:hypothetical protein